MTAPPRSPTWPEPMPPASARPPEPDCPGFLPGRVRSCRTCGRLYAEHLDAYLAWFDQFQAGRPDEPDAHAVGMS